MCRRWRADARDTGGNGPDHFRGRRQERHGNDLLCEMCASRVWDVSSRTHTVDLLGWVIALTNKVYVLFLSYKLAMS